VLSLRRFPDRMSYRPQDILHLMQLRLLRRQPTGLALTDIGAERVAKEPRAD
jgi:hypothetical protein